MALPELRKWQPKPVCYSSEAAIAGPTAPSNETRVQSKRIAAPLALAKIGRGVTVVVLATLVAVVAGCGGGAGGGGSHPTISSVSVNCSPASISANQTSTCNASVTGTGNYSSAVTWTVSPSTVGIINNDGTFTASEGGTATVTATSTQDSTEQGLASISVTNPAPIISGLSPDSVTVGASDTSITVSGSGFDASSAAFLNGTALSTQYSTSSTINATVPSAMLATAKLNLMTVSNPSPGGGTSESTGPWTPVEDCTGGEGLTQTLLPNGKVLVAGGGARGLFESVSAAAELYDPATQDFVATGNMTDSRMFHTATLLNDGMVLITGGYDNNGSVTNTAELYDPQTGTFTATGNMISARENQTATLLPDGQVLIAGGWDNSGNALSSAEIYDPALGTFTATGDMSASRAGQTATLLPDGKVLIAGGINSQGVDLATAELYDPSTGTFSPTGSLAVARESAIAVVLATGEVLIAGGYQRPTGALNEAELYNPATGTFTATGSMGTPRNLHSATLLSDGSVLILGGNDGSAPVSSTEIYDPATGKFSPTWDMITARQSTAATTLKDGSVLVCGGYSSQFSPLTSAEVYPETSSSQATSLSSATLSVTNPLPSISSLSSNPAPAGAPLTVTGKNFVGSSEILLDGFSVPAYADPKQPDQIWFYPTTAGSYQLAVNNPAPGGGVSNPMLLNVLVSVAISPSRAIWNEGSTNQFTATVQGTSDTTVTWSVKEGSSGGTIDSNGYYTAPSTPGTYHVIATSDADPNQSATATVVIGPQAGQFTTLGPTTVARNFHTATLLPNGTVLIAGGYDASFNPTATAEIFNPSTGSFTATGSMEVPRANFSATLLKTGKVLVAGGVGLNSAELYDPSTGKFSPTGDMITPSSNHSAILLPNGKVLIVCGYWTDSSFTAPDPQLYDPSTGTFEPTGKMVTPRAGCSTALLPNGKVLLAGGYESGSASVLSSAELYDPSTGTFSATGSMLVPRVSAFSFINNAVVLGDGKVLVFGGLSTEDSAEIYDPATGTFSLTQPPVWAEFGAPLVTLQNGTVLIPGGCTSYGIVCLTTQLTQIYDPGTGLFAATPPTANFHYVGTTATVLANGSVLIVGESGNPELYTPPATDPISGGIFPQSAYSMTDQVLRRRMHMTRPGNVFRVGRDTTHSHHPLVFGPEIRDHGGTATW